MQLNLWGPTLLSRVYFIPGFYSSVALKYSFFEEREKPVEVALYMPIQSSCFRYLDQAV